MQISNVLVVDWSYFNKNIYKKNETQNSLHTAVPGRALNRCVQTVHWKFILYKVFKVFISVTVNDNPHDGYSISKLLDESSEYR